MAITGISRKVIALLLCALLVSGVASGAMAGKPKPAHQAVKSAEATKKEVAKKTEKSAEKNAERSDGINDPIEPLNRLVFSFNNVIDHMLIEPVAKLYNFLLPGFARDGVQHFMRNLKSPLIVGNALLQGNVKAAGVATARFVINTTAGIGGLVDVAEAQGMPYQEEDFGQTMAVWGVNDGFYLVLPVLGPSSLRDTAGLAVDSYADPLRIWAFKTGHDRLYYIRGAVSGIDTRSRLLKGVEDLRKNSLDYYAAVRSAYAQKRGALVRNEKPEASVVVIPDYDDKN